MLFDEVTIQIMSQSRLLLILISIDRKNVGEEFEYDTFLKQIHFLNKRMILFFEIFISQSLTTVAKPFFETFGYSLLLKQAK